LSPIEIATRLEVQRSTVQRWMSSGKLTDTRRGRQERSAAVRPKSAAEWAAAVRGAYALDATDEELVTMGEAALRLVHDPRETAGVRLNAMGRYIAIVKQLALVARAAEAAVPASVKGPPQPPPVARIRRHGADPRNLLQAVK
jgi:hypothetical protein